jgi:hypothetical protein
MNIRLGHHVSQRELHEDCVLVHEMAHLYLPSQPRRHRWFEEWFAVYVEAMARMHAGYKSEHETWADINAGLHHDRFRVRDPLTVPAVGAVSIGVGWQRCSR